MSWVGGKWALLYYVLTDSAKESLLLVDVLRGGSKWVADHYLVEAWMEVCIGIREVSELGNEACVKRHLERQIVEWQMVRGM